MMADLSTEVLEGYKPHCKQNSRKVLGGGEGRGFYDHGTIEQIRCS